MDCEKVINILLAGVLSAVMCFTFAGNGNVYATETVSEIETSKGIKSAITTPGDLKQVGYDVVYVIDNSRSVWSQQSTRDQAFKNITNLAVGADIQIGGIYFAGNPYSKIGLKSMENKSESEEILSFLNMHSSNPDDNYQNINAQDNNNTTTNIGSGLLYAKDVLSASDPTRERVVVLFSDGVNEGGATKEDSYEIAEALGEIHAKIYCVYLGKGYSDTEVLKKIVNYGLDETNSSYVDYTENRFYSVENERISELSSKFINIFYDMQENMKYHEVGLDSSGSDKFFVPALGVTKLRIYLQGELQEGSEIVQPGESDPEKWGEGNAVFLEYQRPVSGWWTINVKSPNTEDVEGTVTYYVNLSSQAEILTDAGNKSGQLVVRFFDENGSEIKIDDRAVVDASIDFSGDDGSKKSIPLSMKIENGVAISKSFDMSEYGKYDYSVNLIYEDLIDLSYSIAGLTVDKNPPITTDIIGRNFSAEKTDEGFVFAIKESELWTDPEGEVVRVVGTTQLNAANPIEFDQHNGCVYITSKQVSDIHFSLSLEDESHMPATVTIMGRVSDQRNIRIVKSILIIVACASAISATYLLLNWKRKRNELKNLFGLYEQTKAEFDGIVAICEEKESVYKDIKNQLDEALHGDDESPGLVEMSTVLTEEQHSMFGIEEYIRDEYEDTILSKGAGICEEIDRIKEKMENLANQVNAVYNNQENTVSSIRSMKNYCDEATEYRETISKELAELEDENSNFSENLEKINNAGLKVAKILNTPIACNLSVKNISTNPGARGAKIAKAWDGQYVERYYELEKIPLLPDGTLADKLGHLGLYVYGYNNQETDEKGLILSATVPFEVKQVDRRVSEVKMLEGNSYDITVNAPKVGGRVSMRLEVG